MNEKVNKTTKRGLRTTWSTHLCTNTQGRKGTRRKGTQKGKGPKKERDPKERDPKERDPKEREGDSSPLYDSELES